jgi:hypothetical protein
MNSVRNFRIEFSKLIFGVEGIHLEAGDLSSGAIILERISQLEEDRARGPS